MKAENNPEATREQRIFALVMCIPALLICLLLVLVLSVSASGCAPMPSAAYYPQYCLAADTSVLHVPKAGTGIVQNLPAGKQVFPTLEQSGDYVKVEYRDDVVGTLSGYVPKSTVAQCNR